MARTDRLQRRAMIISVVAGLIFVVHTMFNDVHAWPLIWPVVGGVLIAALAARRPLDLRDAGTVAAKGSGMLALVIAAVGVPAVLLRVHPAISDRIAFTETAGALALTLIVIAVICAALQLLAAMLSFPVARRL